MANQPEHNLYAELAEKWLNGTITPEEELIFAKWYNKNQDNPVNIPALLARDEHELSAQILAGIQARKSSTRPITIRHRLLQSAAAAVVLIAAGMAAYLMLNKQPSEKIADLKAATEKEHALFPGGNRAILKLGDGSSIVLDSTGNGNIANQGNTRIIKLNDGKLAYRSANSNNSGSSLNTLTTPRGGQYQITLKDGTVVWLNAASSITFPTDFDGKERKVELLGEAYFDVAQDAAKPFKVMVNNMEVLVLGTQFNIMGYQNETAVKTTLLEGSVKVNHAGSGNLLKPGQQAQLSNTGVMKISEEVDVNEAIAWKNGYFHFEEMDMESIMRQLARWYNIDVDYRGKVTKHFSGKIARSVDASKVFQMLELTNEVHFNISGNKVTVIP